MRLLPVALILGLAASAARSEDEYGHGRIRDLEGGVALQRSSESAAEEAIPNLPFLPGDRVWTDDSGRVEFQFEDGTLLRLDTRSKLDYVAYDARAVLRLWSGSAWLVTRGDGYEIETGNAVVLPRERGTYRIDADAEETRLSVFDGEASLESARESVDVRSGERSWAVRGSYPEEPRPFDRRASDDFQSWNEERDDRTAWAGSVPSYVPEEVRPYAGDLDRHGSWYFVAEVGHVWRPYVASGWRPYWSGRWVWTYYGWTWVPAEPWGWAVSHYGRWDYNYGVGWYWIPGNVWGPGWVSWAVGGDYVGWCPLGYRDRPVALARAVPRGSLAATNTSAWVYTRRADLSTPETARRRVQIKPEEAKALRVSETPQARPTRDARAIEVRTAVPREGGAPRNARMRHTPGDTAPEIAVDNRTTIPAPAVRRSRPRDDEDDERRDARATPGGSAGKEGSVRRERAPEVSATDRSWSRRDEANTNGTGTRPSWSREREAAPRVRDVDPAPGRESGRDARDDGARSAPSAAPRSRDADSDRDVLRRMFRPLSERPSSEPRSAAPRSEPRSEPRAEPRPAPRSEPRTPPRSETSKPSGHAAPRSKDKDSR